MDRRDFMKAGAAAALGGSLPLVDARPLRARTPSADPIRVGLIGCGGRGTGAAVQAALQYAQGAGSGDGLIVAIIPSFGERYIQTKLFDPYRYDGSDEVGG